MTFDAYSFVAGGFVAISGNGIALPGQFSGSVERSQTVALDCSITQVFGGFRIPMGGQWQNLPIKNPLF